MQDIAGNEELLVKRQILKAIYELVSTPNIMYEVEVRDVKSKIAQ